MLDCLAFFVANSFGYSHVNTVVLSWGRRMRKEKILLSFSTSSAQATLIKAATINFLKVSKSLPLEGNVCGCKPPRAGKSGIGHRCFSH